MNIRDSFRRIDGLVNFYKQNDKKLFFTKRDISNELNKMSASSDRANLSVFLKEISHNFTNKHQPEHFNAIEKCRNDLLRNKQFLCAFGDEKPGPFDEGITVSEACKVSKKKHSAEVLSILASAFTPKNALEFGTNVGITSAYLSKGMNANGSDGVLTTVDASGCRQMIAKTMHQSLNVTNVEYVKSEFTHFINTELKKLEDIDLVFIDGNHQYQATLDYFEATETLSTDNAVFVFDDIRWSEGMTRAWQKLSQDNRFMYILDFYSFGICIKGEPGAPPSVNSNALKIF